MITTSSLLFNSQVRSFAEDLPILGSVIELILGERFTDRSEKNRYSGTEDQYTK